jgi:hypothetical protein
VPKGVRDLRRASEKKSPHGEQCSFDAGFVFWCAVLPALRLSWGYLPVSVGDHGLGELIQSRVLRPWEALTHYASYLFVPQIVDSLM